MEIVWEATLNSGHATVPRKVMYNFLVNSRFLFQQGTNHVVRCWYRSTVPDSMKSVFLEKGDTSSPICRLERFSDVPS